MSRYFDTLRSVLERHGGTVEKFIGDAVVAVFGVPVAHEDDALRAVRAAAEIRDRVAGLNAEFVRRFGLTIALRMGVNTGEVVTGGPSAAASVVTGDAVNVAARFGAGCAAGGSLAGRAHLPAGEGCLRGRPGGADRCGDRQANHALWRIVITRMGSHPPARAYLTRRANDGLSKPEIIRCLKRYVAREVYPHLRPGPG